jgi:CheY-like chemotaxis protein
MISDKTESNPKATILVVDDTPENLTLMNNLLKDDYKVKVATNGEKTLKIACSDAPPDLILLDIMMPGMDGYEVCRRLKSSPQSSHIPVIFLTAKTEMEDEKKGLELGAADYITKPISPPIVLARVKNHLALKVLSDILQEKNTELALAKTFAEKANLAKSEFLSSMSHELRSPLHAILGFSQLMASDLTPTYENQKESIEHILKAGWHLLHLIDEILDLAKIESGQVPLSLEAVSLSEIMLECQSMTEHTAKEKGIQILFPVFKQPCYVKGDWTRIKQILLNFLSNAIKYNCKNGRVDVDYSTPTPGRVRVSIQDTGDGLSPEQISQLFMSFNRLGQESSGTEGTGIGLVVAKQLVELMGGTVSVNSTVGEGCVFQFELNEVEAPAPETEASPPEMLQPASPLAKKEHTLLYIEDNPANMQLITLIIARSPELHLLTAVDGLSGIALAIEALPAVILMDINLPDINGVEALHILRANPATQHIPVIALSANAMPPDIQKAMNAGFYRYVTKPIIVTEFIEILNTALQFADREMNTQNV